MPDGETCPHEKTIVTDSDGKEWCIICDSVTVETLDEEDES